MNRQITRAVNGVAEAVDQGKKLFYTILFAGLFLWAANFLPSFIEKQEWQGVASMVFILLATSIGTWAMWRKPRMVFDPAQNKMVKWDYFGKPTKSRLKFERTWKVVENILIGIFCLFQSIIALFFTYTFYMSGNVVGVIVVSGVALLLLWCSWQLLLRK